MCIRDRASSAELPLKMRAARVSEIMKEWGYTLSAESIEAIAEDYAETLRLNTPTPPPLSSRQLVPADRVCCVCDGELAAFVHGSRTVTAVCGREKNLTLWSLSAAPQACILVDKECVDCGAMHMYGSVTTARCMACLLYTSPSPRDRQKSRMPSSA